MTYLLQRTLFLRVGTLAVFLLFATMAAADVVTDEAAKALPDRIDTFRAFGPIQFSKDGVFNFVLSDQIGDVSHVTRVYVNEHGVSFSVDLVRTNSESAAYALLTADHGKDAIKPAAIGTAAAKSPTKVDFVKGVNFVRVSGAGNSPVVEEQLTALARAIAEKLPAGADDIPVLVKHLPEWQTAMGQASYAVKLRGLQHSVSNQPVLDSLSFEGGAEAVAANYDKSQLVIVEFTTPQFAGDNDQRIVAKIQELKNQNQPVPTAYRRVGNYSVFVFNAPDERAANQLIDQVKYQQVVQWLGENPHWYERAENYILRTTGGVVVAVVEASIISFLICLAIGSFIGTLLFRRRRAQQQAAAAYSDAGGGVRLNLDELTAHNPRKLLESGKERQPD